MRALFDSDAAEDRASLWSTGTSCSTKGGKPRSLHLVPSQERPYVCGAAAHCPDGGPKLCFSTVQSPAPALDFAPVLNGNFFPVRTRLRQRIVHDEARSLIGELLQRCSHEVNRTENRRCRLLVEPAFRRGKRTATERAAGR